MKSVNNSSDDILKDDVDKLSKKLYLESPDLWIDFTDKISENNFDEMVLFFATKYNFLSIIEYAIDNNFIDVNLPSKNKSYNTIINHLMTTSMQHNNSNIYNYLKNLLKQKEIPLETNTVQNECKNNTLKENKDKKTEIIQTKEQKKYYPEFICSNCRANVFKSGFSVYETIVYKYCDKENSSKEFSRETLSPVACCNCNNVIEGVTVEKLNNLCILQNCEQCGTNLTVCGIVDKVKMLFDKDKNKFKPSSTSYHCGNCDNLINEKQKEYFGL